MFKTILSACVAVFAIGFSPATADENQARKIVRVAAIQLKASDAGNYAKMQRLAQQAKEQGAELVIYPESSALGWLNPTAFTNASPVPGRDEARFAAIARKLEVWVATSVAEQGPPIGNGSIYHRPYDSGILINPEGKLVLHHRKYNVLQNAFTPEKCPPNSGEDGCEYAAGSLSDLAIAETPFGRTSILVCADAYTYETTTLKALKKLRPDFVIVPWGVTAGKPEECGQPNFNAAEYAASAARFLGTAVVVGANATGERPYGRFLPSWYCGTSGYATATGQIGAIADTTQEIAIFDIPIQ